MATSSDYLNAGAAGKQRGSRQPVKVLAFRPNPGGHWRLRMARAASFAKVGAPLWPRHQDPTDFGGKCFQKNCQRPHAFTSRMCMSVYAHVKNLHVKARRRKSTVSSAVACPSFSFPRTVR